MAAEWLEISYRTSHGGAEILADALSELGASGIATVDRAEFEDLVSRPETLDYAADEYIDSLTEAVFLTAWFETAEEAASETIEGDSAPGSPALPSAGAAPQLLDDHFQIYLTAEDVSPFEIPSESSRILSTLGALRKRLQAAPELLAAPFSFEEVRASLIREEDWSEEWKRFYQTLRVSPRLVIQPSWISEDIPGGVQLIRLDPGSAFGTGYHESTALCLSLLDELSARCPELFEKGRSLDLGTGSGILAIAAAKLGARSLEAIDIDPRAVKVAGENFELNDVRGNIALKTGELSDCEGGYDLMIANLIARLHVELAGQYFDKLNPGGLLLISGIVDERVQDVRLALGNYDFSLLEEHKRGDWWALLCQKKEMPPSREGSDTAAREKPESSNPDK